MKLILEGIISKVFLEEEFEFELNWNELVIWIEFCKDFKEMVFLIK